MQKKYNSALVSMNDSNDYILLYYLIRLTTIYTSIEP